jgi:HSP20 family protein
MSTRVPVRSTNRGVWRPALEVFETTDALEVVAELAGMRADEIDIVIEGDVLTIRGNRQDPVTCERRSYHEARIPYGAFVADVVVPFSVDADATEASYENGFLNVRLPRRRGRTIIATRGGSDDETKNEANQ